MDECPDPVAVGEGGGRGIGATPMGSGWSAEPEPVPVSALAGDHPSRDAEAAEPDRPFREVFVEAYNWQVDEDGYLWGLVGGDMGYDKTDTKLTALVFNAIETEWGNYHADGKSDWAVANAFNELIRVLYAATGPAQGTEARSDETGTGSAEGDGPVVVDDAPSLQSRLSAAEAARDEAQRLRKEDRTWYEMTVSVVEEQRDNYRAARDSACARAERLEKALEPFAKLATTGEVMTNHGTSILSTPDGPTWLACGLNIRVDDIRAARAALAAEGKE